MRLRSLTIGEVVVLYPIAAVCGFAFLISDLEWDQGVLILAMFAVLWPVSFLAPARWRGRLSRDDYIAGGFRISIGAAALGAVAGVFADGLSGIGWNTASYASYAAVAYLTTYALLAGRVSRSVEQDPR